MQVKTARCAYCMHPSDNHSAYRELCLHAGCSCTQDISSANPRRYASGLLYPVLKHTQRVGTPGVKEVFA